MMIIIIAWEEAKTAFSYFKYLVIVAFVNFLLGQDKIRSLTLHPMRHLGSLRAATKRERGHLYCCWAYAKDRRQQPDQRAIHVVAAYWASHGVDRCNHHRCPPLSPWWPPDRALGEALPRPSPWRPNSTRIWSYSSPQSPHSTQKSHKYLTRFPNVFLFKSQHAISKSHIFNHLHQDLKQLWNSICRHCAYFWHGALNHQRPQKQNCKVTELHHPFL